MRAIPPSGLTEREIHDILRQLVEGRSNATGSVTLTPSAASTVVNSTTINANGQPFLFPKTAHAAAEHATTYASITAAGVLTITHANNAISDRTFSWAVFGG